MPFVTPWYYGAAGHAGAGPVDRNLWSVDFPGEVASYLTAGANPGGPPMTIFAWINTRVIDTAGGTNANRGIAKWGPIGTSDDLILRINSFSVDGSIYFGEGSGSMWVRTTTTELSIDTWHSIGITVSGNIDTGLIYCDGSLVSNLNTQSGTPSIGTGMQLGYGSAQPSTSPNYLAPMDGLIASFAQYNSVLNATDIQSLHNAGAGATLTGSGRPITASAVMHAILENGPAGATAPDDVNSAYDMTLQGNASWSSNVP